MEGRDGSRHPADPMPRDDVAPRTGRVGHAVDAGAGAPQPGGAPQPWHRAPPPTGPPPGWAWPSRPVLPDPFWKAAARPRVPRFTETRFYGRPRPTGRTPFLLWGGRHDLRIASVLLGLGAFGVFVEQSGPPALLQVLAAFDITGLLWLMLFAFSPFAVLYQLVIGAPVFEEFVKFGLALTLVAGVRPWLQFLVTPAFMAVGAAVLAGAMGPVTGWPTAWAFGGGFAVLILLARALRHVAYLRHVLAVLVAIGIGASFGFFEHWSTYAAEGRTGLAWRIVFHGGATMLSMVAFAVLRPAPDVRVRWLAWIPAAFLHWLNNASAIPVGITTASLPQGEAVSQAWHNGISVALFVTAGAILVSAPWVRRRARRWVDRLPGLGRPPPATGPRGDGTPPTGR